MNTKQNETNIAFINNIEEIVIFSHTLKQGTEPRRPVYIQEKITR